MKTTFTCTVLRYVHDIAICWLLVAAFLVGAHAAPRPAPPGNLLKRTGDSSVILHWEASGDPAVVGHHIYRGMEADNPPIRLTAAPLILPRYADLHATNGHTFFYTVRSLNSAQLESADSATVRADPRAFAEDTEFLEYLQQTAFDYFWFEANPTNGLVRDRGDPRSHCSIAAVGFGLTALGIGVDHGWITRAQGTARALNTLRTFWEMPQGTNFAGTIGYKGWFYHFLDMNTAARAWNSELSSIDTALLLAGILEARQFFDGPHPDEARIRQLADAIFNRVDWQWMTQGGDSLTHGWHPESGFIRHRWMGYNEAMILYLLGMGAAREPLPKVHWKSWTSGYEWQTHYGHSYVNFPPLFGHQYSHCWIDFRHQSDDFMRAKGLSYFENSRRATLAQREYCIANPRNFPGYSSHLWGLTACDGPGFGPFRAYSARGAPPAMNDDGTIAPTAAGGSMVFTPEHSLPALRFMYDQFRTNLWTPYGFRDAFNLKASWWGPDVLGIDQGPILIMAENLRTGRVWKRFMRNPEIQRGLKAADFTHHDRR